MTPPRPKKDAVIVRASIAFAAGCVAAAALYALLRIVQSLLFTEPNPALVFYSEHAGYFWRIWIVSYAGGMIAFLAWIAGVERTTRVLRRALAPAALLLVVQAVLVP